MRAKTGRILLASLVAQVLALGGCYNCATSLRKAMAECKVEKDVRAEFVPGSKLVVHGNDGAIHVAAGDEADCHVIGIVFVHAPTKQEAEEIAEQVQIVAEPNDGILAIRVEKPPMPQKHRFVSVDLDVLVPRRAHVDCDTSFGRITLTGIDGDITASTQFGRIVCENTTGALDVSTQLGRVIGREIVSDHLVARSQKGSVDIQCADSCPPEMVADVSTEWGKIRFQAPPQYQGALDLESDLGSVKLRTAADVRGTIMRSEVDGTIGSGRGSLRLFTNLGSVTLR